MLRHFHVRHAKPSDCQFVTTAVRKLHQLVLKTKELPEIEGIDQCFHDALKDPKKSVILIGEQDGKSVATALLTFQPAMHMGGEFSCLQELVVDTDARASGIGSKMLKAVEEYSKKRGMKAVVLQQPPSFSMYNEERTRFYTKNGYEELGIARGKTF